MAKIIFQYDFKKDASIWVYFGRRRKKLYGFKAKVDFIPPELLKQIRKTNKESAEKIIYNYLINHPKKQIRHLIINQELKSLQETWRKIENKFFRKLEKITQRPIFTDKFKAYFTFANMFPYDEKENWFMVGVCSSLPNQITTICHEVMHLQFLYYYREYCRKFISENQLQDLKESLTFMLNTDFNDVILTVDNGYSKHQKLREKLQKEWEKEKDFKKFLDKAIEITKKTKLETKKA